jgi:purine-binding chemotaxis protein CheW
MLIMVSVTAPGSVIVFALSEIRFALSTRVIERVVRAVEVSPIADAPEGIIGVINLHGTIVPVLDVRPRFGLTPREVEVDDHFVIARIGERQVAVLVDAPVDVFGADGCAVHATLEPLAGLGTVEGVLVQSGEVVPIQDLARLLPSETEKSSTLKLAA